MKRNQKRMKHKPVSALLTMVMTFAMALFVLAACLPQVAQAESDPVTINLSLLGTANQSYPGSWSYEYNGVGQAGRLNLLSGGDFTLTGSNNLWVRVSGGNGTKITLSSVSISSNTGSGLMEINGDTTITLIGANNLTYTSSTQSAGAISLDQVSLSVQPKNLTITSASYGSLNLTGRERGLSMGAGTSLSIEGNATVTCTATGTGAYYSPAGIRCDYLNNSINPSKHSISIGSAATLIAVGTYNGLSSSASGSTLSLHCDGFAEFRAEGSPSINGNGILVSNNSTLDITGTGIVSAEGGANGIFCRNIRISDCDVYATGTSTYADAIAASNPVNTTIPILMNNAAGLALSHQSSSPEVHTLQTYNAGATHQWKLTNATTADPLTNSSILVSFPGGQVSLVQRELLLPVAPVITSAASYTCVAGRGGSLNLTATGTAPITWSLSGAPAGVSVSGARLDVASSAAVGSFSFSIIASNGILPNATQAFTLTVVQGVAPVITNTASYTCYTGVGGSLDLTATGTAPITWSLSGAPAGISISSARLVVAPSTAVGAFNFSIIANNGIAPNATQNFTLTVKELTVCEIAETGVEYASLDAALEASNLSYTSTTTIKLLNNISYTKQLIIYNDLILDLNGKTLTVDYRAAGQYALGVLEEGARLRLADPYNGALNVTGTRGLFVSGSLAEVTNVTAIGTSSGDFGVRVRENATDEGAKAIVYGGINVTAPADYIVLRDTPKTISGYDNSNRGGYYTWGDSPAQGEPDIHSVWVRNPAAPATTPVFTGPSAMWLTEGYAATSSDIFLATGQPMPTVTKTGGHAAITWDGAAKRLLIPAGLVPGEYLVTLTATGGVAPPVTVSLRLYVRYDTSLPFPPFIRNNIAMALQVGYAATTTTLSGSRVQFGLGGNPVPTVTKTSGNAAITWHDAGSRLEIAAGLPAGEYPVVLTASNGITPDYTHTFVLTVSQGNRPPGISGPASMTLPQGYGHTAISWYVNRPVASSDSFLITGSPTPTVTKTSGNSAITWHSITGKLLIDTGLAPGEYPVTLTATNSVSSTTFAFTLTVGEPHNTPGDVNDDNKVDMQDVLLIYQHFRGKTLLAGEPLLAADVNNDGNINMQDVLLVYQFFRGKISL